MAKSFCIFNDVSSSCLISDIARTTPVASDRVVIRERVKFIIYCKEITIYGHN